LLAVFESAPEARALSSAGITRPQRSYDPVRLPHGPLPHTASKPRPPTARVSPDYPHHPSRAPRPLPRWIERVHLSIASPSARPSPLFRRIGIHIFTFEACSGFTRVTARWIAQPPNGGLCHEAPARPVAQPSRSSATRSIDNSLGGIFLHWRTHGTNIEHNLGFGKTMFVYLRATPPVPFTCPDLV